MGGIGILQPSAEWVLQNLFCSVYITSESIFSKLHLLNPSWGKIPSFVLSGSICYIGLMFYDDN